MMIVFDIEIINAESGEEKAEHSKKVSDVAALIRRMKDGDALVINAREQ